MSQRPSNNADETAPLASEVERRASVRLQSGGKGTCQSLSLQRETGWQATIRDISCNGVGLLLARRFEVGTLLTIEVAGAAGGPKHLLLARVVHATSQGDGNWLVGCALMSPLAEDELYLLLRNVS